MASSEIARLVADPASVSIETARHLYPASAICAAARTSGLVYPQLTSAQIKPDLENRSFLVPAPAGSDPIAHLADITVTAMYSSPDIVNFIKCCQFQTIAEPPSLPYNLATPLLHSLATSGFPEVVGKTWSLEATRAAIKRGPHTSTSNTASTASCCAELADQVS